jgi:hypothetical protein
MRRYTLTTGVDRVLATGPEPLIFAATDTLSPGDVIAAPGGDATLVLTSGNHFDLSAPLVLSGIADVQDQSVGDSVITLRDGLDLTLHLGGENATVYGADNADTIVGGPAGGFATIYLGSARESVVAGPSGASVIMQAEDAGAWIEGGGVTTVQLTGNPDQAVRLGAEVQGVGELDVTSCGLRINLAAAGIQAVALFASQLEVTVGPATTLVTDYTGGNAVCFCATGQTLRLPNAGTAALAPDHLAGFTAGDAIDIDLPYGASEALSYDPADGKVTLTDERSGASATVFITPGAATFQLSADAGMPSGDTGTLITMIEPPGQVPCFAAGTRLRGPAGWLRVECLKEGDLLLTASGQVRPVRWIGHRSVNCSTHPSPDQVLPIRIRAGAFDGDLPVADLRLSPDHAVFVAGGLMPVKYLVNGTTIRRETVARVRYFHVELDSHDLLLAEGLAVESYLDTGNRRTFANGGPAIALHPDFAPQAEWVWPDHAYAPLVTDGPALRAARANLAARAAEHGYVFTAEPDMHLRADGQRIWGQVAGDVWSGWVPPGTRRLTILSRAAAPADHDLDSRDRRRLGVALRHVVVRGANGARSLEPADADWGEGFHDAEQDAWSCWRWTNGRGVVRPSLWRGLTGPLRVELHLFRSIQYPIDAAELTPSCAAIGTKRA